MSDENETRTIHLGFQAATGNHSSLGEGEKGVIEFMNSLLVGGFNPFEKYESNWIISLGRDENKPCLKPPPI